MDYRALLIGAVVLGVALGVVLAPVIAYGASCWRAHVVRRRAAHRVQIRGSYPFRTARGSWGIALVCSVGSNKFVAKSHAEGSWGVFTDEGRAIPHSLPLFEPEISGLPYRVATPQFSCVLEDWLALRGVSFDRGRIGRDRWTTTSTS